MPADTADLLDNEQPPGSVARCDVQIDRLDQLADHDGELGRAGDRRGRLHRRRRRGSGRGSRRLGLLAGLRVAVAGATEGDGERGHGERDGRNQAAGIHVARV